MPCMRRALSYDDIGMYCLIGVYPFVDTCASYAHISFRARPFHLENTLAPGPDLVGLLRLIAIFVGRPINGCVYVCMCVLRSTYLRVLLARRLLSVPASYCPEDDLGLASTQALLCRLVATAAAIVSLVSLADFLLFPKYEMRAVCGHSCIACSQEGAGMTKHALQAATREGERRSKCLEHQRWGARTKEGGRKWGWGRSQQRVRRCLEGRGWRAHMNAAGAGMTKQVARR